MAQVQMHSTAATIECYGDSTILGLAFDGDLGGPTASRPGTTLAQVASPAPAVLQQLLQAQFGTGVTVRNLGVSGTTCANWLAGTGGVSAPWTTLMAASTATYVLICLGINDYPNELSTNYPQMVQIAEQAGHRVVIQTPNNLNISWGNINDGRIATILATAAAHPNSLLVDFYTYTAGLGPAWFSQLSYSTMFGSWSGIHPNQNGYITMAARMFDVFSAAFAVPAPAPTPSPRINPTPALIYTTGDLILFVLRASGITGIGQTPSAEDSNTGLQMLVNLIAQWQKKRWLQYVLEEVSVPQSTGAQSYTIGPGGAFNCARPDYIAAAYIRVLSGAPPNLVDIPVEVLQAREDYAAISVKTLQTMPAAVWYESAWPMGNVWWWPVPPGGAYGLYLTVKAPLPTYSTLTDPLNLPPEYYEALVWAMCVRMQMAYGLPARPDHATAMAQAMQVLHQANLQIPELSVPAPMGRRRGDLSLIGRGLGRAFILDQGAVLS